MIKFFRKIRQNLLSEGKTGKYLKYAIGEIVLVVVGILIALSLNNWNQNVTYKNELKQTVKEIRSDLNKDILSLREEIKFSEAFINNLDNLLTNGNIMPVDSLLNNISRVHRVSSLTTINFGYNKLNKHPKSELLPDGLTNNLTTYYSTYSVESNNQFYEGLSFYSLNLLRDYLIKHGFPLEMTELERPKDISHLNYIINDIEFIGILRNTKHNWSAQRRIVIEALKQAESNLEIINNYLSSIN
ncbi:hypothetical protein FEE95_19920 [Maribacter algarum]|uniref:Uncharacterized protein n=1 Tax=Maribacter algarum (ex Zhang et al. 2020) TaxID=2578118 RepID=A0A5S3PGT4_9FLAO|nr:DUF6090 family protein [Maribacter algarum]TMM53332.1 hypothetical protein FEE95_19920 [Maribacter algarum]